MVRPEPEYVGKTTWIRRQAIRAVSEGNYAPSDLLFCSFTRAAAKELVGRDLPIASEQQIGTLHALAYRALNRPLIAEAYIEKSDKDHITPWNEYVGHDLRLSQGKVDIDEMGVDAAASGSADDDFALMQRYRAQMIPEEAWGSRVLRLWDYWKRWMESSGLIDFTGLIEEALARVPTVPGEPRVGFFDEAQDFTPLQLKLVRQWGEQMDYFILAGDPNQCIYNFTGATPSAFLGAKIPEENKYRLRRAWRMQRNVHDNARRWIEMADEREVFDFEPPGDGGLVSSLSATSRNPTAIIELVDELIADGQSVMILGATSFIIENIKYALRDAGIPFHNPYRRRRGDWNPLFGGNGVPTSAKIAAFLSPGDHPAGRLWTAGQIKLWIDLIATSGIVIRGRGKKYLESLDDDEFVTFFHLQQIFERGALDRLLYEWGTVREDLDPEFLATRLLKSKKSGAEFPLRVLERRGLAALTHEPRVTIGTIHSVKGGEADVVIVFPDLSPAGHREYFNVPQGRDAVIRQFYVALSRAREAVYICQPSGSLSVKGLL